MDVRIADVDVGSAVKELTAGKNTAEVLLTLVKDGILKNYSGDELRKFVLDAFKKASVATFKTPENAELDPLVKDFVEVLVSILDKKQKVVEIVGQASSWLKMLCRK
jgi:hypothetical protein